MNSPTGQDFLGTLPVLDRLSPDPATGAEGVFEIATTVVVVVGVFLPLYKPRPRRILDMVALSQKRLLVAAFALAAIGYFDYTYRLPRQTLLAITQLLLVALPLWFVWIRRRPNGESKRAIIVGDDPGEVKKIAADVDAPLIGCLCPTTPFDDVDLSGSSTAIADGGIERNDFQHLGGLSRIEDVLVEYHIDSVVLAFKHTDRGDFFGALDACYEHGVAAKVHRDRADSVLTADGDVGTLVDVDVEPWYIQDYVLKRAFDVAFSTVGLIVLSPVIAAIATGINVDDGGSILYNQERTAVFGETFDVYKFRSMIENAEADTGATISKEDAGGVDDRVTTMGRFLRRTHLDEVPQLWSVLKGDMSVVGPRPERPSLDADIRTGVSDWRKRWFIKPGLTGLAQVNDVTGTDPDEKLRHDLQYVKYQSFSYDIKLVLRQIWMVGIDTHSVFRDG